MARDEALLRHYEEELNYLREAGREFALRHPRVARHLGMSGQDVSDPHTERLLESFAFLTARIQRQIEANFPEASGNLLGVLAPQFTAPIPSMSIAHFEVDPDGGLTEPFDVPSGTTLYADTDNGDLLQFGTAYPVQLLPIEITRTWIDRDPGRHIEVPGGHAAVSALRIAFRSLAVPLEEIQFDRIRFYIHGNEMTANRLYDVLFSGAVGLGVRSESGIEMLPDGCLGTVGFEADDEVIPAAGRSLPGYRLLQEYSSFPEQFRFFEVSGLDGRISGSEAEIFVLFHTDVRASDVRDDTVQLGCTPIANVFELTTEPLTYDELRSEYLLIPDGRREHALEIHTVREVFMTMPGSTEARRFAPYYGLRFSRTPNDEAGFFHTRRLETFRRGLQGTDTFVSLLNERMAASNEVVGSTVYARTLCTNRGLADELSAGSRLQLDKALPVLEARLLLRPTTQIAPAYGGDRFWLLISQLCLNHLSLGDGGDSLEVLRSMLKQYQTNNAVRSDNEILGITRMRCRKITRRIGRDAWRGHCRGTEIELTFDERLYAGTSALMLGGVLDRFFAMHATANSFTQLVIRSQQRSKVWKVWPPRAGGQALL